jgi:hypothetical protein
MKLLMTGLAIALLALAAPASAQMYPQPAPRYMPPTMNPPMAPTMGYRAPAMPEMMDNGSSSDFPTHSATDFVADQLNRQVLDSNTTVYLPR